MLSLDESNDVAHTGMAAQGQEPGTTQSCDSSSEVKELVRKWLQEFSSTDDVEITLLAVLIAGAGIFGITLVLLPLKWSVLLVAGLVAFLLVRFLLSPISNPERMTNFSSTVTTS